jgi:hypothetical protein
MVLMATSGDSASNAPKPFTLKMEFVEWLYAPKSDREHKTMSAWAQAHDVSRQTLWEWKNQDEEVLALIGQWKRLTEPSWPAMMGTLIDVATDKNHPNVVQAIRTAAELLEKFPEKRVRVDGEITHTVTGLYGAAAKALEEPIEGEVVEE